MTKFGLFAQIVECRTANAGVSVDIEVMDGNDLEHNLKSIVEASLDYFGRDTTIQIIKERMEMLGYEFNE